tara:strand:+ start:1569 stop:1730 length:162 start_codon:yes stop_codon:yes gene_type:complete
MEVSMLTVAQNNLNAARQKKNEQKELDNLLRVFEWCVACTRVTAPDSLLTRAR